HGELLTLGIAISERTVSRYMRGHPTTRSQTWRTFFANHFGGQIFVSPLIFAGADDEDIVVDASDVLILPVPSIDASCAAFPATSVDWGHPLRPSPLGGRLSQPSPQRRQGARRGGGREPPQHRRLQPALAAFARSLSRTNSASASDDSERSFARVI